MNTLQFIDSMTGRLAWPLAAVLLGFAFRPALTQLLGRLRRLKWRETEAELGALAEAARDVEDAAAEAAKPLPENDLDLTRARTIRLLREAVEYGYRLRGIMGDANLPSFDIEWQENGDPRFNFTIGLGPDHPLFKRVRRVAE